MAVIDHIDGPNRDIYLSIETINNPLSPIDIYTEMRTLRKNDETLRSYDVFLSAFGNIPKGSGKYTERYVRLNNGTRIIPYNTTHILTVVGTIITDDGQEGIACFDRSPLSSTSIVDINYVPPQVEVIQIISGSGVTAQDKLDIADAVLNEPVSNRAEGTLGYALSNTEALVTRVRDIEEGNWRMDAVTNQMIFADENNEELFRFNLFDDEGNPSTTKVYKRERV